MTPTPEQWEGVKLAPEGTLMAAFQKTRTDAVSAMFDRDKMCGTIHTTSHLYADLDNAVRSAIRQAREERDAEISKKLNEILKEAGGESAYDRVNTLAAQLAPKPAEKHSHNCADYPECKGHNGIKFSHCEECRKAAEDKTV